MNSERLKSLSKIYGCKFEDKCKSRVLLVSQNDYNWFARLEKKNLHIVLGWRLSEDGTTIIGNALKHFGTDEDAENKIGQSIKEYKNVLIERKKKEMEKDF